MAKKTAAKPQGDASSGETQSTEITRANIHRSTEVSPSYASLYANDIQVQLTPWDVRLILGEIASVPTQDNPTITIRQVGDVHLSLHLAKKLVMILVQQLTTHEKRFGEIHIPLD